MLNSEARRLDRLDEQIENTAPAVKPEALFRG